MKKTKEEAPRSAGDGAHKHSSTPSAADSLFQAPAPGASRTLHDVGVGSIVASCRVAEWPLRLAGTAGLSPAVKQLPILGCCVRQHEPLRPTEQSRWLCQTTTEQHSTARRVANATVATAAVATAVVVVVVVVRERDAETTRALIKWVDKVGGVL